MNKEDLRKMNTLGTGIAIGIIVPVIMYFVLYNAKVQQVQQTLFSNNSLISNILPVLFSHCILPNLIVFFIFNSMEWARAMKGVLVSTVILTVLIFGIKLIFGIL
jgi:hypothetical protein